jgi:hypothetical protein
LISGEIKMHKKHYFLVFLATNLLVTLTNQSAMGFSLKFGRGATSYYNPTVPYVIDANTRGVTYLEPRYVAPIKLGGTNDFFKMLNLDNDPRWLGWNFIPSDKNLYGNFDISTYYACGAQTNCGKEKLDKKWNIRGGVGAYIDIKYNPKKTDPKPGEGKIHWIQRVVNNHSMYDEHQISSGAGVHGRRHDGIDIPIYQNVNPYYDTVASANENSFQDRPYRPDANKSHTWFADLYLVEEIAPKTVKIYNGVRWGWINRVYRRKNPPLPIPIPIRPIPEPAPVPIPRPIPVPIVCNPGSGGGGCSRSTDGIFDEESTNQESSYFNFDDTNLTEEQEQPSFDINDPDWIEEQDPSVLEIENMKWISEEDAWQGENEDYGDSEPSTSIPESTSVLGLIALSAWGIMKALKIRKSQ